MASYEFVEEFDTDDEEESVNTLQSATNINVPPQIITTRAWDYTQDYGNHPTSSTFYPSAFPGENFPQHPPSSIQNQEYNHQPSVLKRKRRRNKTSILLADFSPALKTCAWQKFQSAPDKSEQETTHPVETAASTDAERIKTPTTLLTDNVPQEEEDSIRKLIKKFKSQKAKRARQKRAKLERRASRRKKSVEIDNWQIQQKNIFNKQREDEALVKEVKISLAQVQKKKQLLEDKIKLISSLEKLRQVRRRQLINVKVGFSSDASSSVKSTANFQTGILSLKKQVEGVLQTVTKEEEMIALMAQSQCQHEEQHQGTREEQKKTEALEEKRMRRERKWQKYLYKKMLKLQGFVSSQV